MIFKHVIISCQKVGNHRRLALSFQNLSIVFNNENSLQVLDSAMSTKIVLSYAD